MERIMIGDREVLVDTNMLNRIRKAAMKNRDRSREIARQLKEARLGPVCGGQFAGWVGNAQYNRMKEPRTLRCAPVKTADQRWQEFLLTGK